MTIGYLLLQEWEIQLSATPFIVPIVDVNKERS